MKVRRKSASASKPRRSRKRTSTIKHRRAGVTNKTQYKASGKTARITKAATASTVRKPKTSLHSRRTGPKFWHEARSKQPVDWLEDADYRTIKHLHAERDSARKKYDGTMATVVSGPTEKAVREAYARSRIHNKELDKTHRKLVDWRRRRDGETHLKWAERLTAERGGEHSRRSLMIHAFHEQKRKQQKAKTN